MSLWKLRWKVCLRRLRTSGRLLPLTLLIAAGIGAGFWFAAGRQPAAAALLAALAILRIHRTRGDLHFIAMLSPRPRLHLWTEYLALGLPPALLIADQGAWIEAAALEALAPAAALLPGRRAPRRSLRLRIAWLGYSPEWISGIRRRPFVTALLVLLVAGCIPFPYLLFPALYLAAFACTALYDRNEPLQLVLLPERRAARFLSGKVAAAWRNYFLAAALPAAAGAALHPETAWLAALWAPLAALLLLYAVVAKYARYAPEAPGGMPTVAQLGAAGFLLPPLLPVSLGLTILYALRAERNLNRYLYDYD